MSEPIPGAADVAAPRGRLGRRHVVRAAALVALVVVTSVVAEVQGMPDVDSLRDRVEGAGGAGMAVFVGGYALLALLPAPKGVLTALGGALFGWVAGAALSLVGALIGAVVAFDAGRWLGRETVDRLTHGRLRAVDDLLRDHGLGAVLAVRLVPVLPYTVINYAAGLSGVRRRDYVLGSALGMVPGSLAYSAVGAWGTSPWGLLAAGAALVVLVVVGATLGRRLLPRPGAPRRRPG
ncbi:TVP38/TMEM64 family protein [Nocardioides donggukensis]|uniref:TVP38/TMEM64 family membrane protein n=1 Tax=Nocardioides donggukensis TaxID=2774019 RepID=A0A927Q0B2_9ACTN|nr:TVP38/TMEM64 family protein [Nocardioides donggukensis]MBD8870420.1 TVP38/TMEM64 family protein [Nocardioides donggukensis]